AEAEVEYEEHASPSIYVKFKLNGVPAGLPEAEGASIVIWTTTPWTLPANRGIALHPEYEYVIVEAKGERLILAKGLVERAMGEIGIEDYRVVKTFHAKALERLTARHPFHDLDSLIILGDHVTLEAGTGAVHTAPGHGQDDFVVGQRYDLEVANPVGDDGIFYADTPLFGGQSVWNANPLVCATLEERGALLKETQLTHSYPHCWRCKSPIIFRATPQWFIAMDPTIRPRAIEAIKNDVEWIPAWGRDRILGMMEDRPDWCISRQRSWGVPIVAFRCEDCRAALLDAGVMRHVAEIFDRETADAWYARPASELLPEGAQCPECSGARLTQEQNILDVWFDSGVSHAAVCERSPLLTSPADLYLEGSDQHRGWFNSSLLTSVGTRGRAPFKAVLTHGFVVDAKG
ncbi:MAG: class I tRNA ligase family protein, partial [Myxococcales bacterium]|nr:class I tRNA ligase family protein [Myxococcales bacterium]